jgi:hypothetical protein
MAKFTASSSFPRCWAGACQFSFQILRSRNTDGSGHLISENIGSKRIKFSKGSDTSLNVHWSMLEPPTSSAGDSHTGHRGAILKNRSVNIMIISEYRVLNPPLSCSVSRWNSTEVCWIKECLFDIFSITVNTCLEPLQPLVKCDRQGLEWNVSLAFSACTTDFRRSLASQKAHISGRMWSI